MPCVAEVVSRSLKADCTDYTLIGLSMSIPLGAISLAGASVSGVAMALTKKYQKKNSPQSLS